MRHRPKHYRQLIYDYVEEMLGRPLTFEEHDALRDMIGEYVFSRANLRAILSRTFCAHRWKPDKKIEMGDKQRLYVKSIKCYKRTTKKMPVHSAKI